MNMKTKIIVTWIFAACIFASAQVNAASTSYFLDQSNDLADGTNYAKVTISDSVDYAGDIEFSIEVLTDAYPGELSNFGMQTFYFNFNESLSVAAVNIVDTAPSWSITTNKNAGGGFGEFDFKVAGNGDNRTDVLTFRVAGVTDDTINSYATSATEGSEYFAAHIADYDASVTGNTGGKFGGSSVVPIPAAVWLFASGLGLLGWKSRKSKQMSAGV
jgi:hypothetical protein